ncbi:hypothetical protein T440DRAFT_511395 [Plenodomus tracheiphilus IPT5]|uniref:Pentacotripeptide-repeat region of PRORP domain-containing protein n=1 Tax=Plenodomus tracheiphilus IPT5 TaxID=1408161 RepID=A0A6A7ASF6_9PLEO|nr:hypothetical protein T440DRAFT_511395 [Plenodomus tracheiphilus IPT5]
MLGAYVCRQCRVRIAQRVASPRNLQWQPRATFLSLRPQKPGESTQERQNEPPQEQQQDRPDEGQKGPQIHYSSAHDGQPARRTSRYSNLVRQSADSERPSTGAIPDDAAQDNVQDATEGAIEGAIEGVIEEEAVDAQPSYARAIQDALKQKERSVETAWAIFEKTYTSRDCKALTEPSFSDVVLIKEGKIFTQLLNRITVAFCRGYKNVPVTPTEVLFRYEQLGIARPEYWYRRSLTYLTHKAIESANSTIEGQRKFLPTLLHELLSVWRLFFQCKGKNKDPLQSISKDWQLPAVESMPHEYGTSNFGLRLQAYHPRIPGNSPLGFCAVYLYSISDGLKSVESLHQEAAPLLQFFERLLAGSHVHYIHAHTEKSVDFQAFAPEVKQQIERDLDAAPQRALLAIGTSAVTLAEDRGGDEATNLEAFYFKRIGRAVESRSSSEVLDILWAQVEKSYTTEGQETSIPPRIYNAFLTGFMALYKSPRTVEIWNHMIAHGIQPTSRTYTALLDGCVQAKDLDGLDQMWQRMLNTSIEPDAYAWATRVYGLMTLRQVNRGLDALSEMGKKWLAAEHLATVSATGRENKGKGAKTTTYKNTVAKPDVEIINGAITALVQIRPESMRHDKKVEFIQRILGWARNFDIRPDVRTYNALIRLYLRGGDHSTAFKVLRQMEVDGVPGDTATHSMLMSVTFDNKNFDNMTPAEQTTRILSHLDTLEASGIKLNIYLYGIAIDRLLKQYSNYDALGALLEHMTARELVPSAPVYTSLATHYFQQDPPNIAAVNGLVHQIFASHRIPTNNILFDRLVEGYAQHGEVGMMMSVLTRMSKIGTPPGWKALSEVVKALVGHQDFDRARQIVGDVMRVEGVAGGGIMGGKKGETFFWTTVRGLGLGLEEEGMGDGVDLGGLADTTRQDVHGAVGRYGDAARVE